MSLPSAKNILGLERWYAAFRVQKSIAEYLFDLCVLKGLIPCQSIAFRADDHGNHACHPKYSTGFPQDKPMLDVDITPMQVQFS